MRKILLFLSGLFIVVLILSSCNKEVRQYQKFANKGTLSERDSAANFFYEKESYEKAAFLYEELMRLDRTGSKADFYLNRFAYCRYKQGLFVSAAYYFEQFTRQFPNSEKAEEAAFMSAYSYYMQSDPWYLDQSYTRKAIEKFQEFITLFPVSSKIDQTNKLMRELRERQAHKDFESARLYLKLENYKASKEALSLFVRKYPDSRYREEAQFLVVESSFELAEVSTIKKKRNRYLDTIDLYEKFVDRFPNSIHLKEGALIFKRTRKRLGKNPDASDS